jgi:hypothetical protein
MPMPRCTSTPPTPIEGRLDGWWTMPRHCYPDTDARIERVGAWNARKHRMMGPEHVAKAWSHLRDERWLPSSAMAMRMSSGV